MALTTNCPRCGYVLLQGWTSCLSCGRALDAAASDAEPAHTPTPPPGSIPLPPPLPPVVRKRRNPAVIVGLLVAGAVLIGVGVVVSRTGGSSYPSEWDPRVAALTEYVERERGMDFEHPVHVEFLTAAEYSERGRTLDDELSDDDRQSLQDSESVFRALGLGSGALDFLDASNDLHDEGTLAFYDPFDERVVVRGTEITVDLRVTLVHELTHALQDQYFDIVLDDPDATSGAAFAYRALVEGDALRIEERYELDELTADEQEALAESRASSAEGALDEVPAALVTFFAAPYALGGPFVSLLDAEGGNSAVNDAFREPPTSEEHLFDPFSFLDGDDPELLDVPEVPDGAEVIDDGDFGAVGWFVVLSEQIDARQALAAVDGWHGDAFVSYRTDDQVCVRAAWTGDTAGDVDEMHDALDAWARAIRVVEPVVERAGDRLHVQVCDPGENADIPLTGQSSDAFTFPAARSVIAASAMSEGSFPVDVARCFAYGLVPELTLESLVADELSPEDEALVQSTIAACAS